MVIGRGRRREHPNQHCLLLLRVLHNFRLCMRTPKETPKGSTDFWSHPVAMLLLLRKKRGEKAGHAQNILQDSATSGQATSGHVTDVTSGQKAPLGRILCNYRLRMRRTYFRFRWLTSCPVMWLPDTSLPVAPHRSSANATWAVPIYY
jgi:hypothetical protein